MEQVLLVSLLGDAGLLPELPGRWLGDPSELSAAGAAKAYGPLTTGAPTAAAGPSVGGFRTYWRPSRGNVHSPALDIDS